MVFLIFWKARTTMGYQNWFRVHEKIVIHSSGLNMSKKHIKVFRPIA